ncbi:MAG: DMT family transporter [Gammaproteobacteria bacterium]
MQVLWIIFAAFLFSAMGVCVKFASAHFNVLELVFYRSVLGCAFTLVVARAWRRTLLTRNFRLHLWRGISGFFALLLFFFSLSRLHISTAMALLQTSPLFLALLTFVFLREKMTPPLLAALAVSFIGMLFILRPGLTTDDLLVGTAALGAGAASGLAYFNIRRLGLVNEGGIRTVFYFTGISAILATLLIIGYGTLSPITVAGAGWLVTIGLTATVGQLALTRGLHYGHTFVASSLMYTSIIFAGLADFLLWNEMPDNLSWLGIALISAGGIGALHANRRHSRQHRG